MKFNGKIDFVEGSKDELLANRIIDLMEKTTAWRCAGGFDDCILVSMDDKEDFESFKAWYKEAKRMFSQCQKFGF